MRFREFVRRARWSASRSAVTGLCLLGIPQSILRAQAPAPRSDNYTYHALQPGDRLQLKVWREPDLSGLFAVSEHGEIVIPKVGTVNVSHITIDSLTKFLIARFSLSLRDPAIEVVAQRRVNVVGAVRNPGYYYADPTVTIAGSLALAGGVTPDGDQKRIRLTRNAEQQEISLGKARSFADSAMQSGDEIRVPARSWASRNTALIASGITAAALVFAAIIRPD